MKLGRFFMAAVLGLSLAGGFSYANDDTKKDEKHYKEGGCCAKAKAAGHECKHPCCVAAEKDGKVCEKCNAPAK